MVVSLVLVFAKLSALDNNVNNSLKRRYQPGSVKNLRSYINRYLDFCIEHGLSPIPATGQQTRRFIQFLADSPTISAMETISNYMWGLKTFHKLLELPPPDTTEFITKLLLKGVRLTLAKPIKQAQPIMPRILEDIFVHVDVNSDEQVAAWTALLYAFHMLLRKSNIVPDTQKQFDPEKQISRDKLCVALNSVLVKIVWSKTLQFQEKTLPPPSGLG